VVLRPAYYRAVWMSYRWLRVAKSRQRLSKSPPKGARCGVQRSDHCARSAKLLFTAGTRFAARSSRRASAIAGEPVGTASTVMVSFAAPTVPAKSAGPARLRHTARLEFQDGDCPKNVKWLRRRYPNTPRRQFSWNRAQPPPAEGERAMGRLPT